MHMNQLPCYLKADNTVRECKNTYVFNWMNLLVQRFRTRVCGIAFLRKSHSHDKLGTAQASMSAHCDCEEIISLTSIVALARSALWRLGSTHQSHRQAADGR